MKKRMILLTIITLLCCGCSTSAPNGETQNRTEATEASEKTLYEQIRQFIQDNNFKTTYPEAILEAVEKGENSYLQITTPDFAPVEVAEMEAQAKEKGIPVKAVSGNIYGIYGEYEDGLWTLKGYYFDPEGAECKDCPEPMNGDEAMNLYRQHYKEYEPNDATLTGLMIDACRMAYCIDGKKAQTEYLFQGGYYLMKYYDRIKELKPVELTKAFDDETRADLYEKCTYCVAPLDYNKNLPGVFPYFAGNLCIDPETYQCTLKRGFSGDVTSETPDDNYVRNYSYVELFGENMFYALDARIVGRREWDFDIPSIKTAYYEWGFFEGRSWIGYPKDITEDGDEVSFLYGDITRLVWNKENDEVWMERDENLERSDKYPGKYIAGKDLVPGSWMIITKQESGGYQIDICSANHTSLRLEGYEKNGKIVMAGNGYVEGDGFNDAYAEAEIINGENDDHFRVRFWNSTMFKDGTEIDFFRL